MSFTENVMHSQFPYQGLCAFNTIEYPERMLQLLSELRCRERELLLRREGFKETVHIRFMKESSILVHLEELVQIKCVLHGLAVDFDALFHLITDDVRHLVCEEVEARKVRVRAGISTVLLLPFTFRVLFIGICPVVDGTGLKLVVCKGLEWRT